MNTVLQQGMIGEEQLQQFKDIVGESYVFADEESLEYYSHDETEHLRYLPEVVLKPRTAQEISEVMKICNELLIPVTPRGGGTGLSGGALPHLGGVLISMERFNTILQIDERNLQVTTEPGVITEVLQNAVKEKGLFYPPDPSSRGSCFIGGNIAENSGGPKAVKYGVVKDYVLNLEVGIAFRRNHLDRRECAEKQHRLQPYATDGWQRRNAGYCNQNCIETYSASRTRAVDAGAFQISRKSKRSGKCHFPGRL